MRAVITASSVKRKQEGEWKEERAAVRASVREVRAAGRSEIFSSLLVKKLVLAKSRFLISFF